MNRVVFEQRYVRPVITGVCAYEATALLTRRLPSVSALLGRARTVPIGQVALWGLWGWFTTHIFAVAVEARVAEVVEEMV